MTTYWDTSPTPVLKLADVVDSSSSELAPGCLASRENLEHIGCDRLCQFPAAARIYRKGRTEWVRKILVVEPEDTLDYGRTIKYG